MGTSRETRLSSHNKWNFRNKLEEMSLAQERSRTLCRKGPSRDITPGGRAQKGPSWSLALGSALGPQRTGVVVGTAAEVTWSHFSHCSRGLPHIQVSPALKGLSSPCPCCPSLCLVPSLSPAVHVQSLSTVPTFPSSPLIPQQPLLLLLLFSHPHLPTCAKREMLVAPAVPEPVSCHGPVLSAWTTGFLEVGTIISWSPTTLA